MTCTSKMMLLPIQAPWPYNTNISSEHYQSYYVSIYQILLQLKYFMTITTLFTLNTILILDNVK